MKIQGTSKIGFHCSAGMIMEKEKDGITVRYYKTHHGHSIDLEHIPLSSIDLEQVVTQMKLGIDKKHILDTVRDTMNGTLERIHLITNKQLHRVEDVIGLKKKYQRDPNDLVSVRLLVDEFKLSPDNPVIFFKNQGDPSEVLGEGDFGLAFMDSVQCAMLQKFGSGGVICMDGTHGTNPYDFTLITLLTIDDYGEGYPAAFFYTNRENEVAITEFLKAVREKAGVISCASFMSDDASQYYNSWTSAMGHCPKKLLCTWHVDRAWSGKINLIRDGTKRNATHDRLKAIHVETCKDSFDKELKLFLDYLLRDQDLVEFGKYFQTYYASRPEQWAYCYRLFSNINTNMYLESMHRVIKHVYLKGLKVKRLDYSIYTLLKFTRDNHFNRIIKLVKGKHTAKSNKIDRYHASAKNMSLDLVTELDNFWSVSSQSEKGVQHSVSKNVFYNCESDNCHLSCDPCKCCIHTYSCTCTSFLIKGDMCKHIHLVCLYVLNTVDVDEQLVMEIDIPHSRPAETTSEIAAHVSLLSSNHTLLPSQDQSSLQVERTRIREKLGCLIRMIDDSSDNEKEERAQVEKSVDQLMSLFNKEKRVAKRKIVCQKRYFSTKKKRSICKKRLRKPNVSIEVTESDVQNDSSVNRLE